MEKKALVAVSVILSVIITLPLGIALGYYMAPSLEALQIQNLQGQISNLQNQLAQKNNQIQILQGQINDLNDQIAELEALVGPIKRGAWNLIKTFEGSSGITTDYFYVAGTELRLNWTWSSSVEEYALFSIVLYKEGQTIYTKMFFDLQDQGTTYAHNIDSANYYLEISEANIDYWTVTVEVWIPE